MKKLLLISGTRPNFIKITRFRNAAEKYQDLKVTILHTGQHYDEKMADSFFKQFGMIPDIFLGATGRSVMEQMCDIMIRLERSCTEIKPDIMLVPGDVNSTLAAALVANKLSIPLGHIESGLRSFDRGMPEEHNRVLTDHLSDLLFVTEGSGMNNLVREGIDGSRVHFVGNTMIDTLVHFKNEIQSNDALGRFGLREKAFCLVTMHRPSNVDSSEGLGRLSGLLKKLSQLCPVIFPVHPRTFKRLHEFGLGRELKEIPSLTLCEPLDYFSFQKLVGSCAFVLTDSGGVQEETTFLGIPCLTMRPNTERPVTLTEGTNELIPFDEEIVLRKAVEALGGKVKRGKVPSLWDGRSTERIMDIVYDFLFRT